MHTRKSDKRDDQQLRFRDDEARPAPAPSAWMASATEDGRRDRTLESNAINVWGIHYGGAACYDIVAPPALGNRVISAAFVPL